MAPSDSDLKTIREALQRCAPETIEAAIRYRTGQDPQDISKIVYGVLRRYMPPASAGLLDDTNANTRLVEDLGLDSMTLLEVLLTAEEVFAIRIENEELKGIRTLGEMEEFIAMKAEADGE